MRLYYLIILLFLLRSSQAASSQNVAPRVIIMVPSDNKTQYPKELMIAAFKMALQKIRINRQNYHALVGNIQYSIANETSCQNTRIHLYQTVKYLNKYQTYSPESVRMNFAFSLYFFVFSLRI